MVVVIEFLHLLDAMLGIFTLCDLVLRGFVPCDAKTEESGCGFAFFAFLSASGDFSTRILSRSSKCFCTFSVQIFSGCVIFAV